jgi:hypothetical protein
MAGISLLQLILISLSILVSSQALSDIPASVSKIDDDLNSFGGSLIKRTPTNNRPYPTISAGTRPYCFGEHNGDSRFLPFHVYEWKSALDHLCGYSTLSPDDGMRSYVSHRGLVAWVAYAQDQSGCSAKSSFSFSKSCMDWMTTLVQTCDGPMPDHGRYGYGGGFVQSSPSGCIEYYIAKSGL